MPPRQDKSPKWPAGSRSWWSATAGASAALLILLLGPVLSPTSAIAAEEGTAHKQDGPPQNPQLTNLVRDILQHEISAEAADRSLWCYRKLVEKDGKKELYAACQTKLGEVDRLMAQDGQPLNRQQRQQENQRIEKLLGHTEQLKKKKQQQAEDDKQATQLLRIIPDAFLFEQQKKDDDCIELKFVPNPRFHPSSNSEMVFHHMEGTLTLDLRQKRLLEIRGQLTSEVKFAGGLLGHLDRGGTFYVKQQEVAPGHWVTTSMDVKMNGKALFFKTIGVRNSELDTDFHSVAPETPMEQIAALTAQPFEPNQTSQP
jgi:hypothetical protein